MKRTIAFLLTLVLVCGLAVAAFADQSAADLLVLGGEITLTEDLILPSNIQNVQLARETVLDLNGHTIASAGKVQFAIHSEVVIRNGTLRCVELSVESDGYLKKLSDVNMEYCAIYAHDGHIGRISGVSLTGGSANGSNWGQVRSFGKGIIDVIEDCSFAQSSIGCSGSISTIRRTYVDNQAWAVYVEEQGSIGEIIDCVIEAHDYSGIDDRGTIGKIQNSTIIGGGAVAYNTAILFRSDKPVLPECSACFFISPRYAGAYEEWDTSTLTVKSFGELLLPSTSNSKLLKMASSLNLDSYRDTPNRLGLETPVAAEVPEPIADPEVPGSLSNFKALYPYKNNQFDDVPEDAWCAENVKRAYEMGPLKGPTDSSFDPDGSVTLAQAVTMAARLSSIYATGAETFVQGDVWYQVYVDYAQEKGILSEDDYQDYGANATREQFATILAKALPAEALEGINAVADDAIPDVKLDDENAEAIYLLYRAGILTGSDEAGTFQADAGITRASAAAIVTRMADTSLRRSVELG